MGVTNDILFSVECEEPEGVVTRNITPFPFSQENLLKLWEKASQFPMLMGVEIPTFEHMCAIFINVDSNGIYHSKGICVQVDDLTGLLWLTDIEWPSQCSVHYTFFDRRHRGRVKLCQESIRYIFRKYQFHRVYTKVPLYCRQVLKFVETIGFKKEGRLRSNIRYKNEWYDSNMYSILENEV